jgi:hypothetical protein
MPKLECIGNQISMQANCCFGGAGRTAAVLEDGFILVIKGNLWLLELLCLGEKGGQPAVAACS